MAPANGHPVPVGADAPILEVMASMRAMRRLKPDPVPDELLRQLIEAARLAPTAADLERFSFVVVTDRAQMRRLATIWQAIAAFYLATFVRQRDDDDPGVYRRTIQSIEYQAAHFAETPAVIVACYDLGSATGDAPARLLRASDARRRLGARRLLAVVRNSRTFSDRSEAASIYPAVQNLLLAARALGLGATLTTWHLMAEGEIKEVLGIPRRVHTFAVIPIGWPIGRFGPVRRRPVDQLIHRDRW
jgi:nitroreductase